MSRHTFQSLFWMLRDFFKLSTGVTIGPKLGPSLKSTQGILATFRSCRVVPTDDQGVQGQDILAILSGPNCVFLAVITRRIRPCLLTQKMPTSNFSGSSLFSLRDWFHFKPTCPSGACEDLLKIPHGQKHTILAIFDFFCLRERFSSNVSRIL